MDLANASAIVTGGAGGLRSANAPRLAQKGAKVVIADLSDERGEALAREVGARAATSVSAADERAPPALFRPSRRPGSGQSGPPSVPPFHRNS